MLSAIFRNRCSDVGVPQDVTYSELFNCGSTSKKTCFRISRRLDLGQAFRSDATEADSSLQCGFRG
jgi:hypothetical protein